MSEMIDKLKTFLDSPEGQESTRLWVEKIKTEEERLANRIERFHTIYKDRINEVMERLIARYNSDTYVRHEYALGYEPREPLLWFMFEYAKNHGTPCADDKYKNDFTGDIYYLGSYVIQVMNGQGSVIRVDKIEELVTETPSTKESLIKELESAKRLVKDTEDTANILVQQKKNLIKRIHQQFDLLHNYEKVIKEKELALKALEPYRLCTNCNHENTQQESLNQYTCRYCDGDSDTNW